MKPLLFPFITILKPLFSRLSYPVFILKYIARIMPTIVSLLSAHESAMQEFHDMRAKDQEHLNQIKAFIKQEHDILSKIIKDYGYLDLGSNNLRDVKAYCNMHGVELLGTMDFLCEALRKNILTVEQCDDFISQVFPAGSRLPVTNKQDYYCS